MIKLYFSGSGLARVVSALAEPGGASPLVRPLASLGWGLESLKETNKIL